VEHLTEAAVSNECDRKPGRKLSNSRIQVIQRRTTHRSFTEALQVQVYCAYLYRLELNGGAHEPTQCKESKTIVKYFSRSFM